MTNDRESNTKKGPQLEDGSTEVLTLSAQQLRGSTLLPSLFKTINQAFLISEDKRLGATTGDRLKSTDELVSALRDDPESFIIVLTQPHSPGEAVSTATCRRYFGPAPDADQNPWACSHTPNVDVEEWELKLLVTHPSAQGKGLASYMLELAEGEVVARFRAKSVNASGDTVQTQAKMILCTPKPLFGEFYAKRGYHEDYLKLRQKPDVSFEITFMSKMLFETANI